MDFKYQRVEQQEPPITQEDRPNKPQLESLEVVRSISWSHFVLVAIILVLSLGCIVQNFVIQNMSTKQWACTSSNVGLERNVPVPWESAGRWVNIDRAIEDEAWDAPELDFSKGIVALPDRWAVDRNISLAQRWPWDPHKGVYLLSSIHNVHCLMLRRAVLNSFDGLAPGIPSGHAKHCFSLLLQDTLCNADDALQYTGAVWANRAPAQAGKIFFAGEGQHRMCRNWSALMTWAEEHSACYRDSVDTRLPTTEFYKFCPDNSMPWLGVQKSYRSSHF